MKISVVDVSPSSKKLQVEIPAERVQEELDKKYRELAKQVKIPGFRPGKVPRQILKSYYGKSVESDVSSHFVQETYPAALRQANLKPLAEADLEESHFQDTGAFSYVATVEVRPPFEIDGYRGLEVHVGPVHVSDEQLQGELEQIRERHAQLRALEVERPIQAGDFVVLDVTPSVAGKVFQPGVRQDHLLEVGKKSIHPDFDTHLWGRRAGEAISFDLVHPENSPTAEVAGKTVHYEVTIIEVKEKVLPELDDDFARQFPNTDTLEDLKKLIRERLERAAEAGREEEMRDQLAEQLLQRVAFDLPARAVEREVDQYVGQLQYQFLSQGLKIEPASLNSPEIRAEYRTRAERSLRLRLILDQIAQQEGIELSAEEMADIDQQAARVLRKDIEAVRKLPDNHQVLEQLKDDQMHAKVWQLLKANARTAETAGAAAAPAA